MKWTPEEDARLLAGGSMEQLMRELRRTEDSIRNRLKRLRIRELLQTEASTRTNPPASGTQTPETQTSKDRASKPRTSKTQASQLPQGTPEFDKPEFGHLWLPVTAIDTGEWLKFGLVSDTHLCCREERLAELHCVYDLFQQEGISVVFHAGNIVDGYLPRINGDSVHSITIDGQALYVCDNYPARRGITTYFITGDDHEGWWIKEGCNFGAYLQYIAERQGRTDLRYIGHVEADVELRHAQGSSTIIKIQHPGGGSAYARSYTGQKQVEAFEGGEKPHVLIQGHYHVSNYMQDRNIHVISLPGFQDQTVFARKKRLRMEVGGAILSIKVRGEDGTITRCAVEFIRFFTRAYYRAYLRSDARLLSGHLILPGTGGSYDSRKSYPTGGKPRKRCSRRKPAHSE